MSARAPPWWGGIFCWAALAVDAARGPGAPLELLSDVVGCDDAVVHDQVLALHSAGEAAEDLGRLSVRFEYLMRCFSKRCMPVKAASLRGEGADPEWCLALHCDAAVEPISGRSLPGRQGPRHTLTTRRAAFRSLIRFYEAQCERAGSGQRACTWCRPCLEKLLGLVSLPAESMALPGWPALSLCASVGDLFCRQARGRLCWLVRRAYGDRRGAVSQLAQRMCMR
mmetsp:Transcript_126777/g.355029  ORF Transcript_126777/g.355029 Transcript_126777/m.355029 type:complete len:225 (+) Transcript_126777:74-748(+)